MTAVPHQEEKNALDEVAKIATNIKAIIWFLTAFGIGGVGLGTWLADQDAKNRAQDAAILRIEAGLSETRNLNDRLSRIEERVDGLKEDMAEIKSILRQRGNE